MEIAYGSRQQAAAALNVSGNLLKKIGLLTASSDPLHARKATANLGPTQLLPSDIDFLQKAIPRLILRIAEVEGGMPVTPLDQTAFQ
jgi:hypothetical protein